MLTCFFLWVFRIVRSGQGLRHEKHKICKGLLGPIFIKVGKILHSGKVFMNFELNAFSRPKIMEFQIFAILLIGYPLPIRFNP